MKSIQEQIEEFEQQTVEIYQNRQRFIAWAKSTFTFELDDTAKLDLSGCIPYIYVHNRDDLQKCMTLAPKWTKSSGSKCITYYAEVGAYSIYIFASDGALPPTCKVVKKETIIPAQPERVEIVETIECDV